MYEQATEKDILFMGVFHDPVLLKECLFPENIKAPHLWLEDDCKMFRMRNYQFAWQNYGLMLCDDDSLKPEQNFKKRIDAGTCYNIGARNTGKSYDFIQLDAGINIIHGEGDESCCGSATQGFLKKVLNPVISLYRNHPFFEIYKQGGKSEGIRGVPNMEIVTKHGHTFYGRNEKVDSPEPGTQFHGLHYKVLQYEESHYMTEMGEEKRIDAGHSYGTVERFSGIPDIRVGSPLGKLLSDEKNHKFICRLPQFVREDWSEDLKKKRIEQYNGEYSLAYKLNVKGEKIEGAEGFWDIERLKQKCQNKSRRIKRFDIDKKKYKTFENHIIIDRLPAEQIFICSDIGAGARPTEIAILFYNGKKYRLEYNISLNKLTKTEQAEIFSYLYKQLGSAFIGLDNTTDYGIAEDLENIHNIPRDHIYRANLKTKIPVDFEKDEKGRVLKNSKGKDLLKEVYSIDWAMQRLEYLFYEGLVDIPIDNKFWKEFSAFKVLQSGTRRTYSSSSTDDYHQAFQVFALTQWDKEFQSLINKNNIKKNNCLGYM